MRNHATAAFAKPVRVAAMSVLAVALLALAITTASASASADAPIVSNVRSAKVTATSAELLGEINPREGQTSYRFEWGPTATYGNSTPAPAGDAGAGNAGVPVSTELQGLSPGVTYHFRLVATNEFGTTASPDQTFGFYPPNCPNSQLRQETRSNDLPDCRAYELVTPSFAQGAVIMPVAGPNTGLATNPSRISYGVNWGLFPESTGEATNYLNDLYVSTRTDNGWTQRYTGLPGNQVLYMGGPPRTSEVDPWGWSPSLYLIGTQASPQMDRITNYDKGWPAIVSAGVYTNYGNPSNAPYVFDTATGQPVERWPTNLGQIAGGAGFVGIPRASADFSHFVFSSNVVFAPGGVAEPQQEIECCRGGPLAKPPPAASIYDNDVRTGAVVLASRRKDGTPFEGHVWDVSDDGSHILMAEEANFPEGITTTFGTQVSTIDDIDGPFYLRVGANETYEIAAGHKVSYAGSTADGSTVYLTSEEQLTPEDTDTSRDLYVWHQSEPNSLTLVSIGQGGAGNSDACSPTEGWTAKCGAEIIHVKKFTAGLDGWQIAADGSTGNGISDDYLAAKSGDIYFESPEQLAGAKGEPGEVNLYLYREGTVRYVATMQPGSVDPIARMQVTPDGRYAAFTTGSSLTGYDSGGKLEMYLFDAAADHLACASCPPDGKPAVSNVTGSQNGLFLTNDGRAFFSSQDSLVPRDTNKAQDVYEYTEGRPQLITAGLGQGVSLQNGNQATPGLASVSANGIDVYFLTIDTLVTQDHNGAQYKLYDARTGGGFPAERVPPNCPSADECHGPGAAAPVLPPDRTSAALGAPRKPKAHKARKKHRAKKHHRAKGKHAKKKQAPRAKRTTGKAKQGGRNHG